MYITFTINGLLSQLIKNDHLRNWGEFELVKSYIASDTVALFPATIDPNSDPEMETSTLMIDTAGDTFDTFIENLFNNVNEMVGCHLLEEYIYSFNLPVGISIIASVNP